MRTSWLNVALAVSVILFVTASAFVLQQSGFSPKSFLKPSPIPAAEKAVANLLNDPYSAKFEGSKHDVEADIVCGTVNAKNAFGAYVGRRLYTYNVLIKYARIYENESEIEFTRKYAKERGKVSDLDRCLSSK